MTELKARDIRKCGCCKRGVMHGGDIYFYRLRLEQFVVNPDAVRRRHGLELAIGSLADVMGLNESIAHGMGETLITICGPCAHQVTFGQILCALEERSEKPATAEAPL